MNGVDSSARWLWAGAFAIFIATALAFVVPSRNLWTQHILRSPNDGSERVAFVLNADASVRGWLRNSQPAIVVGCAGRQQFDFYVGTGLDAAPEPGDVRSVRLQFDEEKPEIVNWNQSANHQAFLAPLQNARGLAERLSRARQFKFAFVPFRAEPAEVTFSTTGFSGPWEVIRRACGISQGMTMHDSLMLRLPPDGYLHLGS